MECLRIVSKCVKTVRCVATAMYLPVVERCGSASHERPPVSVSHCEHRSQDRYSTEGYQESVHLGDCGHAAPLRYRGASSDYIGRGNLNTFDDS
eukprot:5996805-Pleurochrysis_carterae.AAC.1